MDHIRTICVDFSPSDKQAVLCWTYVLCLTRFVTNVSTNTVYVPLKPRLGLQVLIHLLSTCKSDGGALLAWLVKQDAFDFIRSCNLLASTSIEMLQGINTRSYT